MSKNERIVLKERCKICVINSIAMEMPAYKRNNCICLYILFIRILSHGRTIEPN